MRHYDLALDDLHDATVVSLSVALEKNVGSVELRTAQGIVTIHANGLQHLALGRAMPWGPSVSINRARLINGRGETQELVIELQSGDELRLLAASFSRN